MSSSSYVDYHESPSTGWIAEYRQGDHTYTNPVAAFHGDVPMVVSSEPYRQARLIPAERWRAEAGMRFVGLKPETRVVAVIPAQPGWRIRHDDDTDEFPVIAWQIDNNGRTFPVIATTDLPGLPVHDGTLIAPD